MARLRGRRIRRVRGVEEGRQVGIVARADVARGEGPRDRVATEKTLFRI